MAEFLGFAESNKAAFNSLSRMLALKVHCTRPPRWWWMTLKWSWDKNGMTMSDHLAVANVARNTAAKRRTDLFSRATGSQASWSTCRNPEYVLWRPQCQHANLWLAKTFCLTCILPKLEYTAYSSPFPNWHVTRPILDQQSPPHWVPRIKGTSRQKLSWHKKNKKVRLLEPFPKLVSGCFRFMTLQRVCSSHTSCRYHLSKILRLTWLIFQWNNVPAVAMHLA